MIIFTLICAVVIAMLLVLCYALMAIASEADYKAQKMHDEWKRRADDEREDDE